MKASRNNTSKSWLSHLWRHAEILDTLGGVAGTGILLWAIVRWAQQWLHGTTGLVTIILLGFGALLWLGCCFILFFRKDSFPKWMSRLSFACVVSVPFLAAISLWGWTYYKNLPIDKIIILVADFEGHDPDHYSITPTIIENLRKATKKYHDVQVKALDQPITAKQGSDFARATGRDNQATLVLWGWYGGKETIRITIHFEVLKPPSLLPLHQEVEVLHIALAELESFTIQERLSDNMNYLTLLTIGVTRYEAADYNGAIARLTDALSYQEPTQIIESNVLYIFRALAFLFTGNNDRAIADFDRAITLAPDFAPAYNGRGNTYLIKGLYDLAIADFDHAITLAPDFAIAYNSRGNTYLSKGLYDLAIADFDRAITLAPDFAIAYHNRGHAYMRNGLYDRALTDVDRAITLAPDFAPAYNNRGTIYWSKGLYDHAIGNFNRAIALKPDYARAYSNRGISYQKKGFYKRAIADFDHAITLAPDLADAYDNRGDTYMSKGLYDLAIPDLDRLIALKPDNVRTYNNRGYAYLRKKLYDRAIADFDRAITLKPDFADAYNNRGGVYLEKRLYDRAIADFDRAITLKPDFADASINRNCAYKRQNGEFCP